MSKSESYPIRLFVLAIIVFVFILINYKKEGVVIKSNPSLPIASSEKIRRTWLLTGDSITEQMFEFPDPKITNVGLSSLTSADALTSINNWIIQNPTEVVTVNFGINDQILPCNTESYISNIRQIVKKLKDAGKVIYIPTIPWSSDPLRAECGEKQNKELEKLYLEQPELRGPNVWSFYKNNPQLIGEERIHPTREGYNKLKEFWLEFIREEDKVNSE